jgi:enoyl-[acyl-carrier-protein] reductase (NADH)
MSIPVFSETKVALKGKKGLIVGIANDQSIAWGSLREASRRLRNGGHIINL